ncbi:voltage-dependent anion-selective channel-like [Watersipora subatra]|uniref:voltage-dependent anion-selective channel-like n=1 Tax=Watersipora subatra TaxID=2589382 RepID=UPI00355C3A12
MAPPPTYSDLGKAAREVFSKGYHFNTWKLEAKTQTESGLKLKTTQNIDSNKGKLFGILESEYKVKDYGLKFVEKWTTDGVLSCENSVEDQGIEGLKFTLNGSFNPSSGHMRGQMKADYKQDYVNGNVEVDSAGGPIVRSSLVAAYEGYVFGYQNAFDANKGQLLSNNFTVGLLGEDFSLNAAVNDGQDFSGSVHHKVSKDLETGVTLGWSAGSNATTFNFGGRYWLSKDTNVRMKVNHQSQVGLSLQQSLKDGLSLTLSALVDGRNISGGGHAVGLAVEYEN